MRLVSARSSSTVGVVRIVKAPAESEEQTLHYSVEDVGGPLLNRSTPTRGAVDRVTVELRAADLFRQFKNNPDKATILSVLEDLHGLELDGKVLSKYPGFIDLAKALNEKMLAAELDLQEFLMVVEKFRLMGIRSVPELQDLTAGFSNQLVHVLDTFPKKDLSKAVSTLVSDTKFGMDSYAFWCLNKELVRWASDPSIPDEDFILHVLGPLQVFAQKSLYIHFKPVFTHAVIEDRIIGLMKSNKLNLVQTIELIVKLNKAGYPAMIQHGIKSVLGAYKEKLINDYRDLAVLISALPPAGEVRDMSVVSELSEILLHHYKTGDLSSSERVKTLLRITAHLVSDIHSVGERELLKHASNLVSNNALIVSKLEGDFVANLYYMSASVAVSVPESERAPFLSLCQQTESVIVGRLPSMSTGNLAKLSLSFASGILSHPNSFKALAATIKNNASLFSPTEFVDAVYGLAYKGLVSKTLLVFGNVDSVAASVPASTLPRLAWATAVADLSVATVWETLVRRIEKEILRSPTALQSLSRADEAMLYEALVACKINRFVGLAKSTDRRIEEFEKSWRGVAGSKLDYETLLTQAGLKVRKEFKPRKLEMIITEVPIYLPEYKLALDATAEPLVQAGGLTSGSVKLRHSLWSKLELNVIGISDGQFSKCQTESDRAAMLGSVIGQFALELRIQKQEDREERKPNEWHSRKSAGAEAAETDGDSWESRTAGRSDKTKSAITDYDRMAGWRDRSEM